MYWTAVICGLLFATGTLGQDSTTPAVVPTTAAAAGPTTAATGVHTTATPVVHPAANAESAKLASKEWRHYKGCEDTCFSLCLAKPTDFDTKCSVLFSNTTLVDIPTTDSCKKADVIRDCTAQCQCSCKRCGFCKQEMVNKCADSIDNNMCLDNVLNEIINHSKCD